MTTETKDDATSAPKIVAREVNFKLMTIGRRTIELHADALAKLETEQRILRVGTVNERPCFAVEVGLIPHMRANVVGTYRSWVISGARKADSWAAAKVMAEGMIAKMETTDAPAPADKAGYRIVGIEKGVVGEHTEVIGKLRNTSDLRSIDFSHDVLSYYAVTLAGLQKLQGELGFDHVGKIALKGNHDSLADAATAARTQLTAAAANPTGVPVKKVFSIIAISDADLVRAEENRDGKKHRTIGSMQGVDKISFYGDDAEAMKGVTYFIADQDGIQKIRDNFPLRADQVRRIKLNDDKVKTVHEASTAAVEQLTGRTTQKAAATAAATAAARRTARPPRRGSVQHPAIGQGNPQPGGIP